MRDASPASGGYIRLYRSLLSWEWFEDSTTLHVFLFLLLSACFMPVRHAGVELAPGQLITSRRIIASRTGLTERRVRTALDHLKSTHEIAIQPGRDFSLITITNFARYQSLLPPTASPSGDPPATHRRPNNKNDKHVNHEKKKGAFAHEHRNEHGNGSGSNPLAGIGLCV